MGVAIVTILLSTLLLSEKIQAHGLMAEPPQRGILGGNKFAPNLKDPIRDAPRDSFAHFPAGDKNVRLGAGKHSQERANNFNWKPFEPLKGSFQWRAGVCGDLKNKKQEHLRGGRYYFDGHISRTYREGGILKVGTSVIAHHNGFVEMHLCDVKKCGGEISEACFRNGHCQVLERARNSVCDSGMSKKCAPIDRNFPGRWYIPCEYSKPGEPDVYTAEFAQFRLPAGMTCDHCVLQWFWTAANNCNPPGVVEYFEGPDGPKAWGNCPGQGGAKGGYTKVQQPCGGRDFPEEYLQCADIEIVRNGARSNGRGKRNTPDPTKAPSATVTASPSLASKKQNKEKKNSKSNQSTSALGPSLSAGPGTTTPPPRSGPSRKRRNQKKRMSKNLIKNVKLFADGKPVKKLNERNTINIASYDNITFKVTTRRRISELYFFINGNRVWREKTAPYYLFGNGRKPHYWDTPIINRAFRLGIMADGYEFEAIVKLVK